MKTGRLLSSLFFALFFGISMLLALYGQSRVHELENQLVLRMQISTEAAASKISTDIERLRGLAELFAREHAASLEPLLDAPSNEAQKKRVFDKVQAYFPEQFASTLVGIDGMPLFSSLTGKVGQMCQNDLKTYAASALPQRQIYAPTMHMNPSGKAFGRHFDIMVPIADQAGAAQGIFFVSLQVALIETTLKLHQLPAHRLLLMSAAKSQQIQTEADAALLPEKKFPQLDAAALAQIHALKEIAGTGWAVLALPQAGVLQSLTRDIWLEIFGIWLGVNLLLTFGFVFFKRETQRLLESDALNRALRTEVGTRQQTEQRLREMTVYDQLTGLTNKQALTEFLSHALASAQKTQIPLAVLFFDLDRFKILNDTLGHGYGDMLLKAVAQRLKDQIPETDLIARWGGDEFIIVMPAIKDANAAGELAESLIKAMRAPFQTGSHEVITSVSIGISLYPDFGAGIDTIVKNAKTAMYRAKHEGRNTFRFYSEEMGAQFMDRLKLENDLRHALERNEFRVYYQPRVRLDDGRLIGAEALLRWQHPERGLVLPQVFLPLLEETGLIVETGGWILQQACRQIRAWHDAGLHLAVSVNLSARELADHSLIERVSASLLQNGIPASRLEIELTEGTLMAHTEQNLAKLAALKGLGIQIAMDDFGTGYSSLAYLKRFPTDTLKIDKSFIDGLPGNEDDESITVTIIRLGMGLALHIVAEGIETPAQRGFLVSKGCHEGQGYLFSMPVPIDEFEAQALFTDCAASDGGVMKYPDQDQ